MFRKKRCPECGSEVKEDWNYCPICGFRIKERRDFFEDIFEEIEKEFKKFESIFPEEIFKVPKIRVRPFRSGGIS
ncbi:MAG: hypothetical protein DRP00_04945, partial [Candidatus Aenigmatarchaeota archaeon]